MELHATVTYTEKAYRTLMGVTLIRRGNPTAAILFRTLLTLLCVLAAILLPLEEVPILDVALSICAVALTICMVILIPQYIYLPIKQAKNNQKNNASAISYRFFDENFTVDATENGAVEHYERRYDSLNRVIETDDYFFLFLNKQAAFIVEKAALTGGIAIDLREKLQLYVRNYTKR